MALAFGKVNTDTRDHTLGNRREVVVDCTLDNSYPTGGYALTATQLGIDLTLDYILVAGGDTGGRTYSYDYANRKLMAFSGGTQVSNATDLSAVTLRLICQGKGTSHTVS